MTRSNERRKRPRPRTSLSRRVGQQPVRKTVVVVCEGTSTEPLYLEALRVEPEIRDVAAVRLLLEGTEKGEVPLTLVRRAIDIKSRAERENGEVDEVWCVFDVEWPKHHPDLPAALALARDHGIFVAISNPCFEIWLILHYTYHAGFLENDEARRLRHALDRSRGKGLDPALYMPRRGDAVRHAQLLARRHAHNGTVFPHDNPSSGMHALVTSVSP